VKHVLCRGSHTEHRWRCSLTYWALLEMLLHSELLSFSNAPLDFEKLASNFMLCVSFSNMLFWSIPVSNRHALKYKIVIHTISSMENTIVASVVGWVSEFLDTHWFWFSLFNFFLNNYTSRQVINIFFWNFWIGSHKFKNNWLSIWRFSQISYYFFFK